LKCSGVHIKPTYNGELIKLTYNGELI